MTRKKIKNMYLRVKRPQGEVTVSAPVRMTKAEIQRFVEERLDWILKTREQIRLAGEKHRGLPEISPELEQEYRRFLKYTIAGLIAKYQTAMGVDPAGFTIRRMKTRWGSCNVRTRHMNFNLALAAVPLPYIEYVVVHEMTHLLEASHNVRFWELMERYLPGARQLRKELNEFQ